MREYEDLPPDWRQRIRDSVDAAPQFSERQRERLQLLLRGAAPEVDDA
jgi:hypothetical protein